MCSQKQRHLDKDEKHVKLSFKVYQMFHNIHYRGQKPKTFDDFSKSPHYIAFVKFGRYLLDINAVNMMAFVEFLIKTGVPIDKWHSPTVYETYLRELTKKETPDSAIERNFMLMQQWSRETGEDWRDFFRKVQPTLATLWIKAGRISPWVLYTAPSASILFERMSAEQVAIIHKVIDPVFWNKRLETELETVRTICEILEEVGL